eukprot:3775665-Ditylum_brightwellii.AAC.1
MGVPLDGAANVFCDNEPVVKNTSMPESTLKKKHISICYHMICEAVAANILRVTKEDVHVLRARCSLDKPPPTTWIMCS